MLDAIIGHASATRAGDYKAARASTNTLLACALTCRAMLSPAQVHLRLYNFVRLTDDGRSHILGHVKVLSADGWLGLADEDIAFTALDDGEYRVIARGASGCPGVGEDTDEGLGVIGEIHAADGAAKVWGTPVEADVDSFSTVVLADCAAARCLEALAVNDAGAGLIVLLLRAPEVLEGGERRKDGTTDPDGVLALRGSDNLDLVFTTTTAMNDRCVATRDSRQHTLILDGARPVSSFCIRSAIPGNMVVPPERTMLP